MVVWIRWYIHQLQESNYEFWDRWKKSYLRGNQGRISSSHKKEDRSDFDSPWGEERAKWCNIGYKGGLASDVAHKESLALVIGYKEGLALEKEQKLHYFSLMLIFPYVFAGLCSRTLVNTHCCNFMLNEDWYIKLFAYIFVFNMDWHINNFACIFVLIVDFSLWKRLQGNIRIFACNI